MPYVKQPSGVLVPANFAAPKRPEMREIATTADGRDITRGFIDPLLLQQPQDDVLQLRGQGDYSIYRELLRDDQVGSTFQQRRLAVISKEWGVDPGGESDLDQAAAVLSVANSMTWLGSATERMLFGIFYDYAVAECMWAVDGRHIHPCDIRVRSTPPLWF